MREDGRIRYDYVQVPSADRLRPAYSGENVLGSTGLPPTEHFGYAFLLVALCCAIIWVLCWYYPLEFEPKTKAVIDVVWDWIQFHPWESLLIVPSTIIVFLCGCAWLLSQLWNVLI